MPRRGQPNGPGYVQQRPERDTVPLIDCGHSWCGTLSPAYDRPAVGLTLSGGQARGFCSPGCASRWLIRYELRNDPRPDLPGRTPTMQIREWAREQGLPVASKARIPRAIAEAYAEAHP